MWVVKLGGALSRTPHLTAWLSVLADLPRPRVVIVVPGGGLFADAVRDAQCRWRFDDGHAHRMAVLAMHQYGLMLNALQPRLHSADSVLQLPGLHPRRTATVWLPDPAELDSGRLPASWEVTSDSIAAWLARCLQARHLLLVKPDDAPWAAASCAALARRGIVDRGLRRFVDAQGPGAWIYGAGAHARFRADLAAGLPSASRILPSHGRRSATGARARAAGVPDAPGAE